MKIEEKGYLNFNLKMLDNSTEDVIYVSGWASTTNVDSDNDLILAGAFDLEAYQRNPILLFSHDTTRPIGKVVDIEHRQTGLYVKAEVHRVMDERVFYAVKNKILNSFSVGFIGLEGSMSDDGDYFVFSKVSLRELSIVATPSNIQSQFEIIPNPCENGRCNLGKKLSSLETKEFNSKKEQDMTEEVVKLLQELVSTNKEMLSALSEKEEKVEEQKEVEEVVEEKTSEEVTETKQEEGQVETKDFNLVEYVKELEVKESNFDALLKASEELQTKLNKFLEENL